MLSSGSEVRNLEVDSPIAANQPAKKQLAKKQREQRSVAPRPTAQMTLGCVVIPLLVVAVLGFVAFRSWRNASAELSVPNGDILLVRSAPDESALLVARFGAGHEFTVTGRSEDWLWLQIDLWDGQLGWVPRPLDILVWQIRADLVESEIEAEQAIPQPTPEKSLMIEVPGDSFTMGSPPGIGDEDEEPAHSVTISAFAIDQTEVTVGQYWQCVEAGTCTAPTGNASQNEPHYINNPRFDNHPVIHVPWSDAKAYCMWRGKRLPTEAEWEMAAGWNANLGAKVRWPWGNEPNAENANIDASLFDTETVGTFPGDRSPSGALDMAGNVQEWVLDWYKVDYYKVSDESDPKGPSNRRGEGTGRVVRGGYFGSPLFQARTAERGHHDPAYGFNMIGFRCVQDR